MEFHTIGQSGEQMAANYLLAQGYKILEANYFNTKGYRIGELDIICRDKENKLIFVEVKSRKGNKNEVIPEENMTKGKIRKLIKAINYYLRRNNLEEENWRLDLICVVFDYKIRKMNLRHIRGIRL